MAVEKKPGEWYSKENSTDCGWMFVKLKLKLGTKGAKEIAQYVFMSQDYLQYGTVIDDYEAYDQGNRDALDLLEALKEKRVIWQTNGTYWYDELRNILHNNGKLGMASDLFTKKDPKSVKNDYFAISQKSHWMSKGTGIPGDFAVNFGATLSSTKVQELADYIYLSVRMVEDPSQGAGAGVVLTHDQRAEYQSKGSRAQKKGRDLIQQLLFKNVIRAKNKLPLYCDALVAMMELLTMPDYIHDLFDPAVKDEIQLSQQVASINVGQARGRNPKPEQKGAWRDPSGSMGYD